MGSSSVSRTPTEVIIRNIRAGFVFCVRNITCLFAIGIQILVAQTATPRQAPTGNDSGPRKFIPTFTVKLRGGERIVPGDEKIFGKFNMVMITRTWFDAIQGDTWKMIGSINPATEIYIQTEGPTLWKEGDQAGIKDLKDVGRYDNPRGHSMGAINKDHPEFFLLDKNGRRCAAYEPEYKDRYLMDFGSGDYQKYWVEAVIHDVLKQPWRGAGIHIDNTGPFRTFPTETPARYDTDEKWCKAALSFIDYVTGAMHNQGAKVWINAGGTESDQGWKSLVQLDDLPNPPDVVGEEGAFATSWGKGDTRFPVEEKWKHSVDFLSRLRKSRQAYFSHTKLRRDATGTDNYGRPVTFWQSLWFAMCSFLLGKNDQLNNAYFFFSSREGGGGYSVVNGAGSDEYERIDLGKAAGSYKMEEQEGTHVYSREFARGYVFVNPTERDARGIPLPGPSKELNHDNFKNDPGTLPTINKLDLPAHHGAIVLRAK